MSNLHRINRIDALICSGRFPNCRSIAEEFEISQRQASRDIEYLRYSMGAPVDYSSEKNGYYYSDHTFTLPAQIITDEEKKTLGFLAYHYRSIGNDNAARLAGLFSRLTGDEYDSCSSSTSGSGSSASGSGLKVPLPDIHIRNVQVFETLSKAINNRKKVVMSYNNAGGENSKRVFCPYKLFAKSKFTYAVGYCEYKNEIRVFRLDRISITELTNDSFVVSDFFNERDYDSAVPFQFRNPYTAKIKFAKAVDLQSFKIQVWRLADDTYEFQFYSSEEFLSNLLSVPTGFVILSPNWLKDSLRERVNKLLNLNQ